MTYLRAETCEHRFATEVESAPVNGFPAGFRIIACTRDKRTGAGEVRPLRVVTAASASYVIQRILRVAPFVPATGRWWSSRPSPNSNPENPGQ